MSLWTPYDPEQVLDLSKAATILKTERTQSPFRPSPPSVPEHYDVYGIKSPPVSPPSFYVYNSHVPYEQCSVTSSPPASSPDSGSERVSTTSSCGTKLPRPFKAVTAAMPEHGASVHPDPNFAAFRAAMLEAMRARNGGSLTVSNPRMRRSVRRSTDGSSGADDYLERRARNNAAAKRSRDLRKLKEDELAIRVAYLERINAHLKTEIAAVNARKCHNCLNTIPLL